MARPRNESKVQIPPRVKAFIPIGYYRHEKDIVTLKVEEYEVIRLLDYEGLTQEQASKIMKVSRPTLTRIYERARKIVATSLTEAVELRIEGGKGVFSSDWMECQSCSCRFNNPKNETVEACVFCGSTNIHPITE